MNRDSNFRISAQEFICQSMPWCVNTSGTDTVPNGVTNVRAPEAWNCGQGKGVRVAVLDSGMDKSHQDLSPNFGDAVSFVTNEGPEDRNGHGTALAGLIAAARNGAGIVGVAPSCDIFNVKVLDEHGSGSIDSVVSALDWCVKRSLHIVVMAFGGNDDKRLAKACKAAFDAGLILIAVPGGFPGNYPFVITAARYPVNSRDSEADLCADARETITTLPNQQYGQVSEQTGALGLVAGSIVLALGTHRFSTNTEVRRQMIFTGDAVGAGHMKKVNALKASIQFEFPP